MPTTLLFGGSFDPVHYGHLRTAQSAADLLHASQVLFIPANTNPLKMTKPTPDVPASHTSRAVPTPSAAVPTPSAAAATPFAAAAHASAPAAPGTVHSLSESAHNRLEMLKLAIPFDPRFRIEDLELRRPPPSYTFDTVQALLPKYGPHMTLLLGADQLQHFHHWHRVQDLLALVSIALLGRPGTTLESGLELIRKHLGEKVFQQFRKGVLPTPLIPISSTDIRSRTKAGLPIDDLTPAPVVEYIRTHHRYV